MFCKLGGAHAAEVAQRFWDDPSRENFGEYTRVCMPLYNPGGALADPDARLRTVLNLEVGANWIRGEQRVMDLFSELRRITCPTLVLAGELDPVCTITDMKELARSNSSTPGALRAIPGRGPRRVPRSAGKCTQDCPRIYCDLTPAAG